MVRSGLVVASLLVPFLALPAGAAGRSGADICTSAGFRAGTMSFDLCVARVDGDDPMAGLEKSLDDERVPLDGKAKVADPAEDALSAFEPDRIKPQIGGVKPPVREGEFPTVAGTNFPGGGGFPGGAEPPPTNNVPGSPPPVGNPPPPSGGGFVNPTAPTAPNAPTAPQINTFTVTVPAWSWGGNGQ